MKNELKPGIVSYSDIQSRIVYNVNADNTPRVDFSQSDIKTLYVDLGISGHKIADIIGVSIRTPYNRLRSQGVKIRPRLENPEAEQIRINNIRKSWNEQKEERLKKIHTPEIEDKRRTTMERYLTRTRLKETLY